MSHEPECPVNPIIPTLKAINQPIPDADTGNCPCRYIRIGYQRGREDAANAVTELYTVKVVDDGLADLLETAIARARGKS